jgi:hypothetical protein
MLELLFFTGGFVLVEELLAVVRLSSVFETIKINYCKLFLTLSQDSS